MPYAPAEWLQRYRCLRGIEDEMPVLMDYRLHDHWSEGQNAITRRLAAPADPPDSDEHRLLEATSRARYWLYQIKEVPLRPWPEVQEIRRWGRGTIMGKGRLAQPVQTIKYSFVKILTGSDLSRRRLALMRAQSVHPGPVVWLTGCAHGDEVGGIVVIQEIFKRLRKDPLKRGELHAFPLMNPLGFEISARHIVVSGEDLNRCFPGNRQGSLAQRIAHTIFTEIMKTRPTLVLDLHNDWRSSIPYTVIDLLHPSSDHDTYARTEAFAHQTGFLLIQESPKSPEAAALDKSLSGSLMLHHVPALTLELGEAYVVNEPNVSFGVRSIWNILAGLDMVEPIEEPFEYPLPAEFRHRFLTYSDQLASSTSGVIRFPVKPGEVVTPGRPVAKIYNAFGKLLETIVAPQKGIVLGHSDSSVAFPGLPVVAFGLVS